jgi:predicted RND superfamily exporter protein
MHSRKVVGQSTKHQLVVEVTQRLKSNAKRQKNKALQRAIEKAKLREDSTIIVGGNASTTNQIIVAYV